MKIGLTSLEPTAAPLSLFRCNVGFLCVSYRWVYRSGVAHLLSDWDFFWRQSTGDGIYNNALQLVRSGDRTAARYIGTQAQALLEWSISRHFTASIAYAHFFAGDFLHETPPGKDVNYFSTWLAFKF